MDCQCEKNNTEDAGFWLGSNSVQMGAFTVVGYLLYRFSQTLPALVRWPIRLFCSLTGLSALWSWVGRLVGTLRGIQSLFKWLSRICRFFVGLSSKFKWVTALINAITGSSRDGAPESEIDPSGLRLIILGPPGGEQTSLGEILLGKGGKGTVLGPQLESTKRRTVMDRQEVTVINTPDVLGPSLGNNKRAVEALRSLQLASPGPHAFLLVIRTSGSSMEINHEAVQEIKATLELFGDGASGFIIPVLTHTERPGPKRTVDQLLDTGGLKMALSQCHQRPELVSDRPDCPPEELSAIRRCLVERVMETKTLRGHFVHELQRREDSIREGLLDDMSSALARKLGHV